MVPKSGDPRRSVQQRMRPLLLGILALVAGAACAARGEPGPRLRYGPSVRIGGGEGRAYVEMEDGSPAAVGIALSDDALHGLPMDSAEYEYVLPLPSEAGRTPIRNAVLDWNPHGHAPAGIYDRPHFDFHFYTIPDSDRRRIVATDPDFDRKAARQPEPGLVPAGYVEAPVPAVPLMGVHWVDMASPEFQGQPFTHTFIFGSWDGRMTFYEPMVTLAFLEKGAAWSGPIPMAARHDVEGLYPGGYRIERDPATREHRVAIDRLALHG